MLRSHVGFRIGMQSEFGHRFSSFSHSHSHRRFSSDSHRFLTLTLTVFSFSPKLVTPSGILSLKGRRHAPEKPFDLRPIHANQTSQNLIFVYAWSHRQLRRCSCLELVAALRKYVGLSGVSMRHALVGAAQYGAGIAGSALVGGFADGTPWPMGWVMGAMGLGSALSGWALWRYSLAHSASHPTRHNAALACRLPHRNAK
jgi:hypothetical protein